MTNENNSTDEINIPEEGKSSKVVRGALQVVSGVIPFAGGFLSAIAGAWSEAEQEKINKFYNSMT